MNILKIDTRDNKKIIIRLETGNKVFEEKSKATVRSAQMILPLVEKLLKKAGLAPQKIDEIIVERGPGSFTGLRVGISIANALSLSLLIKINGKKLGEIETPKY